MDLLIQKLIEENKDLIKDKFDYLFLFVHTFVSHEHENKNRDKILQLCEDGRNKYSVDYVIKTNRIELSIKKTKEKMRIQSKNRDSDALENLELDIDFYVRETSNSEHQFQNLPDLSETLSKFSQVKKMVESDTTASSSS